MTDPPDHEWARRAAHRCPESNLARCYLDAIARAEAAEGYAADCRASEVEACRERDEARAERDVLTEEVDSLSKCLADMNDECVTIERNAARVERARIVAMIRAEVVRHVDRGGMLDGAQATALDETADRIEREASAP
jgi:hypothetical protein